ncbi:hypothetical protein PPOP_3886, partial [Paenibacillus popilliae ATCC 14706]
GGSKTSEGGRSASKCGRQVLSDRPDRDEEQQLFVAG